MQMQPDSMPAPVQPAPPVHGSNVIPLPVERIRISGRHRKDMGDLEVLATSIATEGLLQPIGVTEENVLVFGERRLLAVRDILREPTIDARIVRVSSILAGEYAENEIRKDLTPSERVAIAEAVRTAMPERRGKDNRRNIPKWKGRDSQQILAERVGFGNPETYRQAKAVVEHATPEVVKAMDSGELSIYAASKVAQQPPAEQKRIVSMPKPDRRKAIRILLTPMETRRQAHKTGLPVVASTDKFVASVSAEQERCDAEELGKVSSLYRALELLAKPPLSAKQMVSLREKYVLRDLEKFAHDAAAWALAVFKEL